MGTTPKKRTIKTCLLTLDGNKSKLIEPEYCQEQPYNPNVDSHTGYCPIYRETRYFEKPR
jgi:hypothetical protein